MFLCCLVVKQARAGEKGGGQKVEQLPVKIKGAVMFPNVTIMVVLFFGFLMFVCVFLQKHCKNWGSADFGHCFLGAKSRVYNWVTVGSIIGPHVGSYFLRHMWPSYPAQEFCLKTAKKKTKKRWPSYRPCRGL